MYKYETETVSRRDGACVATIESFTLDDFQSLTDALQWELVTNAVQRWKDHVLPRETKEQGFVNDGKTFSLKAIAEDLARSPGRSSGPSDKDRETGATLANAIRKSAPMEELPDEATSEDIAASKAKVAASRRASLETKVAAQKAVKPWIVWTWNDDLDLEENCIRASHAVRQPEPKKKVSAPKWV